MLLFLVFNYSSICTIYKLCICAFIKNIIVNFFRISTVEAYIFSDNIDEFALIKKVNSIFMLN